MKNVWRVTPHHSSEFDEWVGEGDKEALEYAKYVLEQLWDNAEEGVVNKLTIELVKEK